MKIEDAILAYRFAYPVQTASGKALPVVFSRRPERYSSAPPLSPDARQRIVCSLVSLADSITYTVTVGPAAGVLKGAKPEAWRPRDVAATVLIDRYQLVHSPFQADTPPLNALTFRHTHAGACCNNNIRLAKCILTAMMVSSSAAGCADILISPTRSTSRTTSGQRVALNSVEAVSQKDVDGQVYYVYEHLSQVRPQWKGHDL